MIRYDYLELAALRPVLYSSALFCYSIFRLFLKKMQCRSFYLVRYSFDAPFSLFLLRSDTPPLVASDFYLPLFNFARRCSFCKIWLYLSLLSPCLSSREYAPRLSELFCWKSERFSFVPRAGILRVWRAFPWQCLTSDAPFSWPLHPPATLSFFCTVHRFFLILF